MTTVEIAETNGATAPAPKAATPKKRASGGTSAKRKAAKKPAKKPAKRAKVKARAKTTSRKGAARTKPGANGVLVAKGMHLLVVRVPKKVRDQMWAKVNRLQKKGQKVSLNSLAATAIAKAAK